MSGSLRPARRRAPPRRYLPPQHGAWAMLLLPYLTGVSVAGWRWPDAPLLGAWLAGYPLSYFALQAIKTGRPRRLLPQLAGYAGVAVPLAVTVVAVAPRVALFAPGYAALVAVNAWYARLRRERALLNDLASVAASVLVLPVVATVAEVPVTRVVPACLVVAGYLVGTVLHVKCLIRNRDDERYRWWSIGYHAAVLAMVGWYGAGIAALFGWLLVRAWVLPGRRPRPAVIGAIEAANSLLVLVVTAATWG